MCVCVWSGGGGINPPPPPIYEGGSGMRELEWVSGGLGGIRVYYYYNKREK